MGTVLYKFSNWVCTLYDSVIINRKRLKPIALCPWDSYPILGVLLMWVLFGLIQA
jgi:hypothetical protein